jgi:hypothetical protein
MPPVGYAAGWVGQSTCVRRGIDVQTYPLCYQSLEPSSGAASTTRVPDRTSSSTISSMFSGSTI